MPGVLVAFLARTGPDSRARQRSMRCGRRWWTACRWPRCRHGAASQPAARLDAGVAGRLDDLRRATERADGARARRRHAVPRASTSRPTAPAATAPCWTGSGRRRRSRRATPTGDDDRRAVGDGPSLARRGLHSGRAVERPACRGSCGNAPAAPNRRTCWNRASSSAVPTASRSFSSCSARSS